MEPVHIGVTGINASDNPAPGVGVARSLKEDGSLDCRIAGLAYDAMEPGIYMDWLIDRSFLIPYPSAGYAPLISRLVHVRDTFGLEVVVPTLDSEMPFFMKYQDELSGLGIRTFLPSAEQFRLRGKERLAEIAKKSGISAPSQVVVSSYDELSKAVRKLGLPVMVKGTLYKAYLAHSQEEAMACFSRIVAQWGYPVIIQEVVKGDEMNVIGVGDGTGQVAGMVAAKKVSITELGKIWTGVTVSHPGVLEATRRFVAETGWRGAFEVECMVSGDTIHLIEINPRFPAWVYFATGVGVNLPALLVRLALGQEVAPIHDYPPGKLYVRYTGELVTEMTPFQNMVTRGES